MQKIFQSVISHIPLFRQPVAFEPVTSDGDELTKAIDNDNHAHDNDWQLQESIDPGQLDAFWEKVLTELGPDKTSDD